MIETLAAGLEVPVFWALITVSFVSSFITVALGIGGGALLMAIMASVMPPLALIPIHGVIQAGSNVFRLAVLFRHVHWPPVTMFLLGTGIGVAVGGSLVVNLPPGVIMIGVGCFVIWSVLARPPAWLSRLPLVTGLISSFLTMFFGATGVFVANYTKSLNLPRQAHVASHAAFMTAQHLAKVLVFGFLGFAYGPWAGFLAVMILAGFMGTLAGRLVLNRLSDHGFRHALNLVLVAISIRLIWVGLASLI